ncbi:hypothetical protein Y1Q_0010716 [Alligator mississippiensis]|uniref:Uncharacterized protein n=1 Tax=Alligator mississippiensis TaxID=8496 RepID=A0A151M6K9_ALLMI|nr:hypothetical protein Y1Q_0010716 [Alligator mississippiensis]
MSEQWGDCSMLLDDRDGQEELPRQMEARDVGPSLIPHLTLKWLRTLYSKANSFVTLFTLKAVEIKHIADDSDKPECVDKTV